MLIDFQNSFTVRPISKRVMKESLKSHQTSNASLHYLVKGKYQETTENMKQYETNVSFNNKF